MMRRHDSLKQMSLTLLVAVLCGLVFEADGLHVWAERLKVGYLRNLVLPAVSVWRDRLEPFRVGQVRAGMLTLRGALDSGGLKAEEEEAYSERLVGGHIGSFQMPVSVEAAISEGLLQDRAEGAVVLLRTATSVTSIVPSVKAGFLPGTADAVQVALAGDSMMAVGLAPSLHRDKQAGHNFHFVKAYRSGTGLARPEIFDWLQQYPLMLAGVRPQLVICAIGANDAQNVQVGRKILAFGTPEWDDYYRSRLAAYLKMLESSNTRILWVGMPLMKEKRFSRKMQHLNEVIRSEVALHSSVTWLDPNPALGYSDKKFAQYRATVRGKMIKMRADDGIHMTDDGAAYLLPPIRNWLEHHLEGEGQMSGASGIEPAANTSGPVA